MHALLWLILAAQILNLALLYGVLIRRQETRENELIDFARAVAKQVQPPRCRLPQVPGSDR